MSNIPSNHQLLEWYKEVLQAPSFIETLTKYQKEKLLQFSIKKLEEHFRHAVKFFEATNENNYPPGLPKEKWLEHVVYKNTGYVFSEAIFVLNQFGWHWTLERSFFKIEVNHSEKRVSLNPEIDINKSWTKFIKDGGKLKQPEIALLCFYEGIVIPKPSKESDIAENIALWHGHKSGNSLYNLYDEISDKEKRLNRRKPKTMKGYLEKIKPLISEDKKTLFNKDYKEVKNQMQFS